MANTPHGQKARRTMAGRKTTPPRIGKRPVKPAIADRKQRMGKAGRVVGRP
jgi:hypothetical protein